MATEIMPGHDGSAAEAVIPPKDAEAEIKVTPDRMEAELTLRPPQGEGKALSLESLHKFLTVAGIRYGINERALRDLADYPTYNIPIVIAQGRKAVAGEPARIEYVIDLKSQAKPKIESDGTVNYRDLGIVVNIKKGAVLCVKTPATDGTPGETVLGSAIPPVKGKDALLPAGKNTEVSEDGLQLLATADGQPELVGKRLNIQTVYNIDSDICTATGNIKFVGSLVVKGNVLSGFKVEASGSIDIWGTVETAEVTAGGNIIIREGIQGGEKGLVQAGGAVKCRYIQGGIVKARGSVETGVIWNSLVQSGESIELIGSRSTIVGGRVMALKSVVSSYMGSKAGEIRTVIEVGSDPTLTAEYEEARAEIHSLTKNSETLERLIVMFNELQKAGRLNEKQRENMIKSLKTYQLVQSQLQARCESIMELEEAFSEMGYGSIACMGTIFPGVQLIIGPESRTISTRCQATRFTRTPEGFKIAPVS